MTDDLVGRIDFDLATYDAVLQMVPEESTSTRVTADIGRSPPTTSMNVASAVFFGVRHLFFWACDFPARLASMIDRSRIEIIAALSRRPRLRMNMAAHRGMQRLCIGVRQEFLEDREGCLSY
jgi:hypothetical protein